MEKHFCCYAVEKHVFFVFAAYFFVVQLKSIISLVFAMAINEKYDRFSRAISVLTTLFQIFSLQRGAIWLGSICKSPMVIWEHIRVWR